MKSSLSDPPSWVMLLVLVDLKCCVTIRCIAKWFSYLYIYLFQIFFHCKLLKNIEYISFCYTVIPHWLSSLYVVVCALGTVNQKSSPNPRSSQFSSLLPSSLTFLHFTFRYVNNFKFISMNKFQFVSMNRVLTLCLDSFSFLIWISNCSRILCWKDFSLLNCFCSFIKN